MLWWRARGVIPYVGQGLSGLGYVGLVFFVAICYLLLTLSNMVMQGSQNWCHTTLEWFDMCRWLRRSHMPDGDYVASSSNLPGGDCFMCLSYADQNHLGLQTQYWVACRGG